MVSDLVYNFSKGDLIFQLILEVSLAGLIVGGDEYVEFGEFVKVEVFEDEGEFACVSS